MPHACGLLDAALAFEQMWDHLQRRLDFPSRDALSHENARPISHVPVSGRTLTVPI